jgi:hypothetical protein
MAELFSLVIFLAMRTIDLMDGNPASLQLTSFGNSP